eukprot:3351897-Prymnesium_polylepis.2
MVLASRWRAVGGSRSHAATRRQTAARGGAPGLVVVGTQDGADEPAEALPLCLLYTSDAADDM